MKFGMMYILLTDFVQRTDFINRAADIVLKDMIRNNHYLGIFTDKSGIKLVLSWLVSLGTDYLL